MKNNKSYSAQKGQHVQREMAAGKTNREANRSWSHGYQNPRHLFIENAKSNQRNNPKVNTEYWKSDAPEMQDYAYTSDDL